MKEIIEKLKENDKLLWIGFGLIIFISLILRLTLINFPLWYDEGCSIVAAVNTFPVGITKYLWNTDLQHTPLYFYILHFIMKIFGDSVVVLRLSSLIVSIALLPVTYLVTTKLSSKKVGLIAMLFMGINTFQVLYSIEIRMYPYVILLSLLAINYLIDYDRTGDKKSLIKLSAVNLLNPYFLTGSIIFVIAQFIIYTSYLDYKHAESKKISDYVKYNIFTFLGLIPYFAIITHYAIVRSGFLVTDLAKFSLINFLGMFQNLIACDAGHIHETRFEPFNISDWTTTVLVFLPVVAIITGMINSLKDKEKLTHLLLGIVTLSFVIGVLLSMMGVIAFTGRYLIFITPFIFILSAIGFSKLNKYALAAIVTLYSIGCISGFIMTYPKYERIAEYSLKSPADYVKTYYPGKDNLVIMPFASSVSSYYFKGKNMPKVMPLELFHEVRNPDSKIIYDETQKDLLTGEDKYRAFQNIITGYKPISKNLITYLDSYISKVPKGGYIIWVVYYSDNYAILPPNVVRQMYSNLDNVKSSTMTGMISKFDNDLIDLLGQRADFIGKDRDDSNQFFVFRRR